MKSMESLIHMDKTVIIIDSANRVVIMKLFIKVSNKGKFNNITHGLSDEKYWINAKQDFRNSYHDSFR